jgi:3-hydroxyacyl-CoA dehydrogenase
LLSSREVKSIRTIVVLGGNGTMGSGAAALFAAAGVQTVLLARTRDRAEAGRTRAQKLVKGKLAAIDVGTYDDDLVHAIGRADLVFEAVAENLAVKREVLSVAAASSSRIARAIRKWSRRCADSWRSHSIAS